MSRPTTAKMKTNRYLTHLAPALLMIVIVTLPNFMEIGSVTAGTSNTHNQTLFSSGEITSKNSPIVLIEWSISSKMALNVTNVDYAVNITKFIGADSVLLVSNIDDLANISNIEAYVQRYENQGLSVYMEVAAKRLLYPADLSVLFTMNIKGIAIDIFGNYTQSEAENSVIALYQAIHAEGKQFAYYNGDGLSNVNATLLASYGIIVWAWWTGGWKPGTWNLPNVWAHECIYNRVENGTLKYTTPSDIAKWYQTLGKEPAEGYVWWLTTCLHQPTQEQILEMKQITSEIHNQG